MSYIPAMHILNTLNWNTQTQRHMVGLFFQTFHLIAIASLWTFSLVLTENSHFVIFALLDKLQEYIF